MERVRVEQPELWLIPKDIEKTMRPVSKRFVLFPVVLCIIFGATVFVSISAGQPPHTGSGPNAPAHRLVALPSGVKIDLEVADTPQARQRGLMFRDRLPHDGILFVFQETAPHRFWMKNCKFPIDIIWLDPKNVITDISENVPPCLADPCPTYGPARSSLYVLEVAAGFSKKEHLSPGMRLGL